MLIISASIHVVRIPFVAAFAHHLATHHHSRSLVVRLTLDSGVTGYGEGAPRPYVTGEDETSALETITLCLRHMVGRRHIAPDSSHLLDWIAALLDEHGSELGNAARCALETALLDAVLRERGQSLAHLIPPQRDVTPYSGVITTGSLEQVERVVRPCVALGLPHLKIKIAHLEDYQRVAHLRDLVGPHVSLRVDANGAFDHDTALRFLDATAPCRLDAIEQPLPRGDVAALAALRTQTAIPIVVDESLITCQDAAFLIAAQACDIFNLRLSKCGGLQRTLRLAIQATAAGMGLQLGCQVGETAILAALGCHTAAHLSNLRFVEGCFGTHLLKKDLTTTSVTFGAGGAAPTLCGAGLGVTIDPEILNSHSTTIRSMP